MINSYVKCHDGDELVITEKFDDTTVNVFIEFLKANMLEDLGTDFTLFLKTKTLFLSVQDPAIRKYAILLMAISIG